MNPSRERRIREVIRRSQPDLTVVLENVHDPLNISAVMRSCDAVGVREIFVVYTERFLQQRHLKLGKKTSGGAFKWIDVYVFEDLGECFRRVRERYGRILSTHLGEQSVSLYDLDLTQPAALVFGNEDDGLSPEAVAMADGNFIIPHAGFTESLNVSVACAVSLFEARRQRALAGYYDDKPRLSPEQQESLFQRWRKMLSGDSWPRRHAIPVSKDAPPLLPVYLEREEYVPGHNPKSRSTPLTKFDL
ncbi:MAG: RNA methyltransferase [Saprospiraceae bacterium]|nr:RNA methyltransferase [Saprospiraceae bacterium]MDW8230325.1 RNA methyltransferase [Saprospiraceae bacterium]